MESTVRLPDRYVDLGALGRGGMGEVRRVRDVLLDRVVAMKILRADHTSNAERVHAFEAEARTSSRLQHEGVVPIYDLGRLDDGRPYFTLREVSGRSLRELVADAGAGESLTRLRRLLNLFVDVCVTVGQAHRDGVVHCDLKPDNVLVDTFDSALVVDWGLALPVGSVRATVAGTPGYMPPEQLGGGRVDARTDVYALGTILREILAGHSSAAASLAAHTLMDWSAEATSTTVEAYPRASSPSPLVEAALRARDPDPLNRHPDAIALADDVRAWLDGVRQREIAEQHLSRADAREAEVIAVAERAVGLRAEAAARLAGVAPWAPSTEKVAAWRLQDEAEALEAECALAEAETREMLRTALLAAPEHEEINARMVGRLLADHRRAEGAGDTQGAARAALSMRTHLRLLPADHAARLHAESWLDGSGALTVVTTTPARVRLSRYVLRDRRLVPELVGDLGLTPIRAMPLPMGSYLCELSSPGYADLRLPVRVGRNEHASTVPPGAVEPAAIGLLRPEQLGPDDVPVAAGWFIVGGESRAEPALRRRRLWCEGFVAKRFPVTNAQYVAFLNDLVDRGQRDLARAVAPAPRLPGGELGPSPVGPGTDGRYLLQADAEGDVWRPDAPVVLVDLGSAAEYAAWASERDGLPWRLPTEYEREKAARGVDGRVYPWGDAFDPSWCCMRDSRPGRPQPADVQAFPDDRSVYGVRGVAGGVLDWCANRDGMTPPDDGERAPAARLEHPVDLRPEARGVQRGGNWNGSVNTARCERRIVIEPGSRTPRAGIRLVRDWPATS